MSASSRNESESSLQHRQQDQSNDAGPNQKYSEFNFNGDDSDYGNQSIKSEPRRDIVSPPPQEIKKHKIFLSKNNPANNSSGSVTNARFNAALTIPGHNPLPLTNTHKITKKYNASIHSNTNKIQSQPQSVIQGSGSVTPTPSISTSITSTSNPSVNNGTNITSSNSAVIKNRRHDTYNKNIYIGTKNAQKWEMLRTKLQCKNDVEFVTHLLNLMEKYTAFKKQEVIPTNSGTSSR